MFEKPANEAPRIEEEGHPAPKPDSNQFRIKLTHASDGTFVGWLDYSGPGNWVYYTGEENTPGGMTFEDYYYGGNRYLNPVGTYVGNARYLGLNDSTGDSQAAWNYWARATAIEWNGKDFISAHDNPLQHLVDNGGGWVYWGSRMDTALKAQRVPA